MDTPDEAESPAAAQKVLSLVRKSFRGTLSRAIGVASRTEDGHPQRSTQVRVAKDANISRSALAKYLGEDSEADINPDLKTLCRLAATLNVPPAYLLMTNEDWQALAYAAGAIVEAARTPALGNIAFRPSRTVGPMNPAQQATAGFDIASKLGMAPKPASLEATSTANKLLVHEIGAFNERVRDGILSTCALPPLASMKLEYEGVLLYLCAVIGANHKVR